MNESKPVLQALVLADHVYVDQFTGKKVLAGTFNHIWATEFPTKLSQQSWAYVCLTEVKGQVPIVLRFSDLSSNEVLMETNEAEVRADNPLSSVEMIVQVPPFPMPHEGAFAFELYSRHALLGSLRIQVSRLKGT